MLCRGARGTSRSHLKQRTSWHVDGLLRDVSVAGCGKHVRLITLSSLIADLVAHEKGAA